MKTETKIKWTQGNKLEPQDVMTRARFYIIDELQKHLIVLIREFYCPIEGERLGYSREEVERMALITYKELLKSIKYEPLPNNF